MSDKRTITLSDRPPVKIDEESWPVIASREAEDTDNDQNNQYRYWSNWDMFVRQHKDGRVLVYAVYKFNTPSWAGRGRDRLIRHGKLLATATTEETIEAIKEVGSRMADCEHYENDASRWGELCDECIADLPAEDLDKEMKKSKLEAILRKLDKDCREWGIQWREQDENGCLFGDVKGAVFQVRFVGGADEETGDPQEEWACWTFDCIINGHFVGNGEELEHKGWKTKDEAKKAAEDFYREGSILVQFACAVSIPK